MTRVHTLMTGGLVLLMATGCGGDSTVKDDAGWTVEERADQSVAADMTAPEMTAADQGAVIPAISQCGGDVGCVAAGCGVRVACVSDRARLSPCPPQEWGAFALPAHRCECSGGACAAPTCASDAACAAGELCVAGLNGEAGTCMQTSCGALAALYDSVVEQDVVPCAQDADCEAYTPSYDCCRGWPIPRGLRYEAEKIDAYIQRTSCAQAIRDDCATVDCAPPRAVTCDQRTERCALGAR